LEDIQNITNGSVSIKQSVSKDDILVENSLTGMESGLQANISQKSQVINNKSEFNKWKFFGIMLPAAVSDSINPCEFAVMLLLVSTILAKSKSRRRALLSG